MKTLLTLSLFALAMEANSCADKIETADTSIGKILYSGIDLSKPGTDAITAPIVVMDADGKNSHTVAHGVGWGAANGKVLYITGDTNVASLNICDYDGSNVHRVMDVSTIRFHWYPV